MQLKLSAKTVKMIIGIITVKMIIGIIEAILHFICFKAIDNMNDYKYTDKVIR